MSGIERASRSTRLNKARWTRGSFVSEYANRGLRPAEVVILVRYRAALSGKVLELGSGAGRLTGYLATLAEEAHGIDLAPEMVEYANRAYPGVNSVVGDLQDLSNWADGSLSGVFASCNILDVLSDAERRVALREIRRVLASGGFLVMSSHNRAYLPSLKRPTHVRRSDPLRLVWDLLRLPTRVRNDRRLSPLEMHAEGYEIVNDGTYDFSLLHYFIGRDDQERQLADEGFELVEALDLDGKTVAQGETAPGSVELHYVAQPV
jgi:SAM-dependent methyltransferase